MTEAALTWHRLPSRVLLLRVLEVIKSFAIPLIILFVLTEVLWLAQLPVCAR